MILVLSLMRKNFSLEDRESLLMVRDPPSLNRNITLGIITPIRYTLVMRYLLEFYLILIVAS